MPDILTHILFAESVRDSVVDSNIRQFIGDNVKLFNLAAQGPDFLFYYKPWNPFGRAIREAGERMHHNETSVFFKDAVGLLGTLTGDEYEKLLVYIIGFLCHYYCDKTAHPYVYSMIDSGCYNFDGSRRKLSHYQIEATIDTRLWSEEKRMSASRTNVSELVNAGELPSVISDYISGYIYKTQEKVISNAEINKSISNMMNILNILYDPGDKKKKILNRLPLPRKCYVDGEFLDVDVLNTAKRPWIFPGKSKMEFNLSVGELLSGAIKECSVTVNAVIGMLENGNETDLEKIIPNEDYCTGEDLSSIV